ncbi:hypothetical protein VE03_05297 [Pseudogymnoascus sp. 23342-1-I1]|nr:hypothetical protein VE03_05297 [Pseudogymnoascus sp. 23342-1-I1]
MAALLQQGHISLLSFCQIPKLCSDLPSWVPDWSRSATDMLQDVENDHITLYPEFSAYGRESRQSELTITQKDGVISGISVMCHVYDEIYKVGSFPSRVSSYEVPISETYLWPVQWLAELLRLTYYDKQSYAAFSDRLRAAARTSIGGVGYNTDRQLVRVRDDRFLEAVVLLRDGIKNIKGTDIKLGVRQLLADKAIRGKVKSRIAAHERLGSEIIGKSLGRLPFITRKGHLVLSSEHARQGDFVALIGGAQVPFLLRCRSGGQYQLISEAYVDGIMDGEAMENSKCDSIDLV